MHTCTSNTVASSPHAAIEHYKNIKAPALRLVIYIVFNYEQESCEARVCMRVFSTLIVLEV